MTENRISNITSEELGCQTGLDWERVRAIQNEIPQTHCYCENLINK